MNLPATQQPRNLQAVLGEPTAEWQRPAIVSAPLRNQAAAALAKWPERYAPADMGRKLEWLVRLGLLVAGSFTPADAKAKAEAMAEALEHPVCCFGDHALKRAAAQFKFWPSFAELKEALDAELYRQKTFEARLHALLRPNPALEAPKVRGKMWADMTEEERAAHDKRIADLRAELSKPDPMPAGRYESQRAKEAREARERVTAALSGRQPIPMGDPPPAATAQELAELVPPEQKAATAAVEAQHADQA